MTLKAFRAEIHRICAQNLRVPKDQRLENLEKQISKLPPEQREIAISIVTATIAAMEDQDTMPHKQSRDEKLEGRWTWLAIISGISFILLLLVIAIFIPEPTKFQIFIFRGVLALAAAGFGAAIPGFLFINLPLPKKGLARAGGALALFLVVYYFNPPELVTESRDRSDKISGHVK